MNFYCCDRPPPEAFTDPRQIACMCPLGICDVERYVLNYVPPPANPPRPAGMKRGDARKRGQ